MIFEYLNSLGQESRNECQTVGGPDPGKSCIFPFKFQDKIYNECPFDPDDQSKTWCSTKVDSNGNHVVGQKKWGHCGASCPETDKKETYFSGMRQFQISKIENTKLGIKSDERSILLSAGCRVLVTFIIYKMLLYGSENA